jgi:hypothetical protein
LTLALETGYQASEKPVGEAIVDSVLSKQIDDLEPTLTRHGYTAKAKVLTEMLGTKPGVRIPEEVARESAMMSPTLPI